MKVEFKKRKERDVDALMQLLNRSANMLMRQGKPIGKLCTLLDCGPTEDAAKRGAKGVFADEMFIEIEFMTTEQLMDNDELHELQKMVKTVLQMMGMLAY